MGPGSLTCTRWPQAEALPNGSTGDREPGWELMGDSGAVASGWGEEREGQDVLAWRLGDSMKRLEWRREKQAQKNWWNRLPSPHSGKMRARRLPGGGSQNRAPQPVLSRHPPPGASRQRKRDASHTTAPGGRSTLRVSPAISTVPVACWRDGGPVPQRPAGEGPTAEQDGAPTAGPSARRAAEGLPPSPPHPSHVLVPRGLVLFCWPLSRAPGGPSCPPLPTRVLPKRHAQLEPSERLLAFGVTHATPCAAGGPGPGAVHSEPRPRGPCFRPPPARHAALSEV